MKTKPARGKTVGLYEQYAAHYEQWVIEELMFSVLMNAKTAFIAGGMDKKSATTLMRLWTDAMPKVKLTEDKRAQLQIEFYALPPKRKKAFIKWWKDVMGG